MDTLPTFEIRPGPCVGQDDHDAVSDTDAPGHPIPADALLTLAIVVIICIAARIADVFAGICA